jgi:hypothetical protein
MNLFAKTLQPLKPILKQKSAESEKSALFYNALATVTIGPTLYPHPDLL